MMVRRPMPRLEVWRTFGETFFQNPRQALHHSAARKVQHRTANTTCVSELQLDNQPIASLLSVSTVRTQSQRWPLPRNQFNASAKRRPPPPSPTARLARASSRSTAALSPSWSPRSCASRSTSLCSSSVSTSSVRAIDMCPRDWEKAGQETEDRWVAMNRSMSPWDHRARPYTSVIRLDALQESSQSRETLRAKPTSHHLSRFADMSKQRVLTSASASPEVVTPARSTP